MNSLTLAGANTRWYKSNDHDKQDKTSYMGRGIILIFLLILTSIPVNSAYAATACSSSLSDGPYGAIKVVLDGTENCVYSRNALNSGYDEWNIGASNTTYSSRPNGTISSHVNLNAGGTDYTTGPPISVDGGSSTIYPYTPTASRFQMVANQTHVVTGTYVHNSVTYTVTASYRWNSAGDSITYSAASISVPDVSDPTLSSSTPADNSTGVAVGSNIVLNFSEAVDAETGNITIKKTSDDSTVATIPVGDAQVSGSGTSTITINPASDLTGSTEYYVLIDATAFDDTAGNSYAGISSTTALSFTTADVTAPTLSSSTPADNSTGVAVNSNIVLNFSEAVDAETGNITIKKTSDNSTVATIPVGDAQVSGSGTSTITINPASDLTGSTEYYVLIDATAFDDTAGNSYAGISSTTALSFTTADVTAPTLSSSTPADNSTGVAVGSNIVLNFSEAVDAETGNITIKKTSDDSTVATIPVGDAQVSGSGTSTITINPASDLTGSTEYYVLIDATAFDDTAGNSYAGISSTTALSFTTADVATPTLSSSTPADNATDVAVGSNIVLNFSEAVDAETGNITIKKTSDDSTVATIPVGDAQVSGSGTSTITINPASDLTGSTEYYVLIDATAFDDTAGNSYAGISSTTALSFTTADVATPTLSSSTPADNATDVAVGSNIVLNFSEAVDAETGNITIKKTSDDSTVATIPVGDAQVSGSGTSTITINPTSDLTGSTEYYVLIDVTAFDDTAGNSYAGISSTTALSFTTVSTAMPDPTEDQTVKGQVVSHIGNVQKFATVQMVNVQSHLRRLHSSHQVQPFQNNLRVNASGKHHQLLNLMQMIYNSWRTPKSYNASLNSSLLSSWEMALLALEDNNKIITRDSGFTKGMWVEGNLDYGTLGTGGNLESKFQSSGISFGSDYLMKEGLIVGIAAGFGWDTSEIDALGSKTKSRSPSLSFYSSYKSETGIYIDGMLGYGRTKLDNERWQSTDSVLVKGDRNGKTYFGSLSASKDWDINRFRFSPFLRGEYVTSRLTSYSETGNTTLVLTYDTLKYRSSAIAGGTHAYYEIKTSFATFTPMAKLQYKQSNNSSPTQTMYYSDLPSTVYSLGITSIPTKITTGEIGVQFSELKGVTGEFVLGYSQGTDGYISRTINAFVEIPF